MSSSNESGLGRKHIIVAAVAVALLLVLVAWPKNTTSASDDVGVTARQENNIVTPTNYSVDVGPETAEVIDVALGVPPMSNEHREFALSIVEVLLDLPVEERSGYIDEHYPQLGASIVAQMRQRGLIESGQTVENISYRFGSMDGVIAEQANGDPVEGSFDNQVLAVIKIAGVDDPLVAIVVCGNGLINFPQDQFDDMQMVGAQAADQLVFTIKPDESLMHYVSYQTAMDIAEAHDLKVTWNAFGQSPVTITVAEARELEDQTGKILVRVIVHVGDTINVADMTYSSAT